MRHFLAFIFSLALSFTCLAQTYLVYTVKGDVVTKATRISPGDKVTSKTVLTIPSDGRLTIIDEKTEEMFTLKEGIGTVPSLAESQSVKSRVVTASFMAFVKEKMTTKGNPKDVNYMQAAGVTYRGAVKEIFPLQSGEPGTLLDPLREVFAMAKKAIDENDADLLLSASDKLDSLGVVRYDFQRVSEYKPQSFNGFFVFDPLCLVDLAANLDDSKPFAEQIAELPAPITPATENILPGGNILCDHYVLQPGQSLELAVDCSGYCEIAVLSLSGKVKASFDGKPENHRSYSEETTAHIVLTNDSENVEAVTFAINAE